MFRISAARLASVLAALVVSTHAFAGLGGGVGAVGSVPLDPLVAQAGVAHGTWIESAGLEPQLIGTLADENGVVLYDLRAIGTPVTAYHGTLVGEVRPRALGFVAKNERLLLHGQYTVSDATSGAFRVFVVRDFGSPLAPQVPLGVIDGRYGRLELVSHAAQLSIGASPLTGVVAQRQDVGGKIECPYVPAGTKPGLATGSIVHGSGGVIACPHVSSERVRKYHALQAAVPKAGATKPLVGALTEAAYLRRLRAWSEGGDDEPLGPPMVIVKYHGAFTATWSFAL
ncbi:MAG: hypothetical protein K8S98_01575 [Planctomycetes bacterium]|nr:hypothetical protein [Planctomycetota bacterium]